MWEGISRWKEEITIQKWFHLQHQQRPSAALKGSFILCTLLSQVQQEQANQRGLWLIKWSIIPLNSTLNIPDDTLDNYSYKLHQSYKREESRRQVIWTFLNAEQWYFNLLIFLFNLSNIFWSPCDQSTVEVKGQLQSRYEGKWKLESLFIQVPRTILNLKVYTR